MHERNEMVYSGIARLELELLVRDFFAALSSGAPTEVMPFLHNDVELVWCSRPTATGPRRVLRLWRDVVERIGAPRFQLLTVATTDQTVLVEHVIHVARTNGQSTSLSGFAAVVVHDFQVIRWRELCL